MHRRRREAVVVASRWPTWMHSSKRPATMTIPILWFDDDEEGWRRECGPITPLFEARSRPAMKIEPVLKKGNDG